MPTTTVYNRGAVVLLPFPFSDQSSSKIHPAVIVSPHTKERKFEEVVKAAEQAAVLVLVY